jgi:lipoyl(octanoyl) transferase
MIGRMGQAGEMVFEDVGRMSYSAATELQRQIHVEVLEGARPSTVLLLEHDPVITLSKRRNVEENLLVSPARLAAEGVEVARTDRGGDITYHGPGQLVAYPIVRLRDGQWNVRRFVHALESAMIETVATWGVAAVTDDQGIGVWVEGEKLGAVGIRVERWVTLHGLALNVTTTLSHFDLIVPCGLKRPVTSLEWLMGTDKCPAMSQVKQVLSEVMEKVLAGPAAV